MSLELPLGSCSLVRRKIMAWYQDLYRWRGVFDRRLPALPKQFRGSSLLAVVLVGHLVWLNVLLVGDNTLPLHVSHLVARVVALALHLCPLVLRRLSGTRALEVQLVHHFAEFPIELGPPSTVREAERLDATPDGGS